MYCNIFYNRFIENGFAVFVNCIHYFYRNKISFNLWGSQTKYPTNILSKYNENVIVLILPLLIT